MRKLLNITMEATVCGAMELVRPESSNGVMRYRHPLQYMLAYQSESTYSKENSSHAL